MTAEYIYKCADALKKVFKTGDPDEILRMRGAKIKNTLPDSLRGMICIVDGETVVFVGECKSEGARTAELARLLGHAVLHRDRLLSGESFEDVYYPKNESALDREASIFAADLLISDEKIRELECFGYTEGQIAASLGSIRELAPFKFFSMRCRGEGCVSETLNKCDVELFLKSEV